MRWWYQLRASDRPRIIFEHVLAFLRELDGLDRKRWRVQDSAQTASVECRETGARVRCLGSDPRRLHGIAPWLVLADEPAQWLPGQSDAARAALDTSLGKVEGGIFVALGTKPATEDHWFSRLLAGSADYFQEHAARREDPPFRRRTWKKANPSLDFMPALERKIRAEARDAKVDPGALASFRALRLNLGTEDTAAAFLIEVDQWLGVEVPRAELPPATGPCCWGVDLGATAAGSAVAAHWPRSGRFECFMAFPEKPGLGDRGLRDGVGGLYGTMAARGELLQLGTFTTDVPALLRVALTRFGAPASITADRWREGELREALQASGVPLARLIFRGQGFKDGSEDVRAFRRTVADGRLRTEESLLMRSALRSARVVGDPAGNWKLAKKHEGGRRERSRDDAAAAGILAVASGTRLRDRPAPRLRAVVVR